MLGLNGFANEFAGSFLLFFGALALTNNYFGHKLVSQAVQYGYDKEAVTGQMANGALAVAHIGVGFLVAALVISFGGATGPALNPARDLMPLSSPPHFVQQQFLVNTKVILNGGMLGFQL